MSHEVFISYAHADKTVADAVCATLEAAGLRCWIAPRDVQPGAQWTAEIINAISASRVVVLVFSTCTLDGLPSTLRRWWTLGKLHAYRSQTTPFVHLDSDVYLWSPLPRRLTSAPVFGQNPERFPFHAPPQAGGFESLRGHPLCR
jgi:hypothetical protein